MEAEMTTLDTVLNETTDTPQPAYGRFLRRVRAMFIDCIVFIVMIFGALFAMVTVRSDAFSLGLGLGLIALVLLYEPVLVSLAGGTIGHILSNLRVVDDRTQGNISVLKALARLIIKTTLGWYSFITMATTLRHQAMHDLLTGSTVQIRNLAEASPNHYVRERSELSNPGMPSRARRATVILAYMLASLALLVTAVCGLILGDVVSLACLMQDRCSHAENLTFDLAGLTWLVFCALSIVYGWRAQIFGCRMQRTA
jgi:RDD family protein